MSLRLRAGFACFALVALSIMVVAEFGTSAKAAERYRICIALLNDSQNVLITEPFVNFDPRDMLEEKFSNWSVRNNFSVKNVQCQPPVSSDEVRTHVRIAVEFNRKIGNVPKMIMYP